jgi:hypothetical protein
MQGMLEPVLHALCFVSLPDCTYGQHALPSECDEIFEQHTQTHYKPPKASQVTLIRCLNKAYLWFKPSRAICNMYKAIVEVIGINLALSGEGMEQT